MSAFWTLDVSFDSEATEEALSRHGKVLQECAEAVAALKEDFPNR